jgi:lantibiotic modifying enzyme
VDAGGRYLEAARAGLRFESAWFDRSICSWRDPGSGAPTGTSWCRGAVGVGLARLRVAGLIGDPTAKAEAGAALALVHSGVAALADTAAAPGRAGDSSICHGLMGVTDLLVHAATVTSAAAHRDAARRLGAGFARAAAERGHWVCGTLDLAETPGLMLGLAGIGAALLRIERPELGPVGLPVPIR